MVKDMQVVREEIWTWLRPDVPHEIDRGKWFRHGGKWIVFDRADRIRELADRLAPAIDAGEIAGAKYWNGDPSAINVYSLDRDRMKTGEILKRIGARHVLVWEYDFAWDRNLRRPITFAWSWFSKFRTIVQSKGIFGTLRLIRDVLKPGNEKA